MIIVMVTIKMEKEMLKLIKMLMINGYLPFAKLQIKKPN